MSVFIERQSSIPEGGAAAAWAGHPLEKLVRMPYPGPREFFLARDSASGTLVGKLGACLSLHEPGRGYLGFFWIDSSLSEERSRELSRLLLEEGCRFLKQQGATVAIGPVHYNTWLPYRFRTAPWDDQQFSWEPHNPPEWPVWWQDAGFQVEMTYASEGFSELARFAEKLRPAHERAVSAGFRFVPIDPERLVDGEIPRLHELSMKGFMDAFLFEPLPEALFRELYVPLADKNARGQLRHSCFIVASDGRTAGFSFNFVQGSRLILKTIAVLPEFRGQGLSNAAMFPGVELAVREGIEEWVTALVRTGAQSESYGRQSLRNWRHDYSLFSRKLV